MFFKSTNEKYGIALMNEIGKTFGFIQNEFPKSRNPMSYQDAFELLVLLHFIAEYSLYKHIVTKDKITHDIVKQNKSGLLINHYMSLGKTITGLLINEG